MMKPVLVTFDVYMALLDIEGSLAPVVSNTLGLSRDAATAFVRTWRAKQMERAAISNSLNGPRTSFRDGTAMGLDYVAARGGIGISPNTRNALILAWDDINPWPEADEAIATVKNAGCQTAILSNGDQDMLEAVARQFAAGFDHVLSSEAAGKYKPHPAVYDLPTKVLGLPKSDLLHIAGSANDVLGAVAAGLRCVWSNRHGDVLLDPAYQPMNILPDLSGVAGLFNQP